MKQGEIYINLSGGGLWVFTFFGVERGIKISCIRLIIFTEIDFLDCKCLPEGSWICFQLQTEHNHENIMKS